MKTLQRLFGLRRRQLTPPASPYRKFALCRNAPPGTYSNTTPADLLFEGRVLIEAEDTWNDDRTRGTHLDGELTNRLAIYVTLQRGSPSTLVGEQIRRNPRVVMLTPEIVDSGGLPLMSLAEEFASIDNVIEWILNGPLIFEGALRHGFTQELAKWVTSGSRVLSRDQPGTATEKLIQQYMEGDHLSDQRYLSKLSRALEFCQERSVASADASGPERDAAACQVRYACALRAIRAEVLGERSRHLS